MNLNIFQRLCKSILIFFMSIGVAVYLIVGGMISLVILINEGPNVVFYIFMPALIIDSLLLIGACMWGCIKIIKDGCVKDVQTPKIGDNNV